MIWSWAWGRFQKINKTIWLTCVCVSHPWWNHRYACAPLVFSGGTTDLPSSYDTRCSAGQYKDKKTGRCLLCSSGRFCPDGTIEKSCPKGTYSSGGAERCTDCGESTYADYDEASSCTGTNLCYTLVTCSLTHPLVCRTTLQRFVIVHQHVKLTPCDMRAPWESAGAIVCANRLTYVVA